MASFDASDIVSYLGSCKDYFAIVGAVCCGLIVFKVGKKIFSIGLRAIRRSFPVDLPKHGRWAVVTGCTDGIGRCYALQLAEKGMDVVLISRNPQKLSNVQREIEKNSKSQVKVIVADFKKTDIYEKIKQQLEGLDIGILVNNVGMLNARSPDYHCDAEDFEQFNKDIINVNILSCVMMTGIALPGMLERQRGVIINIGSGAGVRPLPFFSIYSATKAFVDFFTRALNMEYSAKGVSCQLLRPNMVESNMSRDMSVAAGLTKGMIFPDADTFVKKAVQTIGRECVSGAHWPHELQQFITTMVPESMLTGVMLQQRNKMVEHMKKK
ncbi:very-long-chain 3-oxoacyl-CoA reductase-like [Littorina saxatilis]|uniref:Uncharacterized protein n=1 Tax=Littorina saxatilis TaxID=31220 RepID=A0AAN9B7M0_9CAEN